MSGPSRGRLTNPEISEDYRRDPNNLDSSCSLCALLRRSLSFSSRPPTRSSACIPRTKTFARRPPTGSSWSRTSIGCNRVSGGHRRSDQQDGERRQIAEYKRINTKLDPAIHLYSVPGNHDVGNEPTPQTLAAYRKTYGPDYYSFREGQRLWNRAEFQPVQSPGEGGGRSCETGGVAGTGTGKRPVRAGDPLCFSTSRSSSKRPMSRISISTFRWQRGGASWHCCTQHGVHYVFAGHYHRNAYGRDGDLEMITTGPAGMPIGPDPSGFRIAEVTGRQIEQQVLRLGQSAQRLPACHPRSNIKLREARWYNFDSSLVLACVRGSGRRAGFYSCSTDIRTHFRRRGGIYFRPAETPLWAGRAWPGGACAALRSLLETRVERVSLKRLIGMVRR